MNESFKHTYGPYHLPKENTPLVEIDELLLLNMQHAHGEKIH